MPKPIAIEPNLIPSNNGDCSFMTGNQVDDLEDIIISINNAKPKQE